MNNTMLKQSNLFRSAVVVVFFLAISIFGSMKVYSDSSTTTNVFNDELHISPTSIGLKPGSNEKVNISGISDYDPAKLNIYCNELCFAEKEIDGSIVFKLNPKFFNVSDEEFEITLEYNKNGKIFKTSLKINIPARIKVIEKNESKIELIEGEEFSLLSDYKYSVDNEAERSDVSFKIDASFKKNGDIYLAQKPGSTIIEVFTVTENPIKIANIPVLVLPAIKSIERDSTAEIIVTEQTTSPLKIQLIGTDDKLINDFSRVTCEPPAGDTYLDLNKKQGGYELAARSAGDKQQSVTIECSIIEEKRKGLDTANKLSIPISVIPKKGYMNIEEIAGKTLLPNGSLSFNIRLFDLEGSPKKGGIMYELENARDSQWVSLSNFGERLIVNWVNLPETNENETNPPKRPHSIRININAILEKSSSPIASSLTIYMATVARFDALKVKMNVMDERTVSDLYGSVTNNEYYVLMVRFFNDLGGSDPNKNQGESILAYSSSIEIAVGLEKQYDKRANIGHLGVLSKEQMKELQNERSARLFADYKTNLKKIDAMYDDLLKQFNEQMKIAIEKERESMKLEIAARSDRRLLESAKKAKDEANIAFEMATGLSEQLNMLYQLNVLSTPKTPAPDTPINDGRWYPASKNDLLKSQMEEGDYLGTNKSDDYDSNKSRGDGEPTCIDTITYRPFTFEMMVNTVDRRQERSPKTWMFKVLNFIGLGASTVTAVAVPGTSSDLPVGLDKFGNFLIPGLEQLLPSYKEQYRQNIVSQAMKPIEEIPFGSDITRVIFIPKKSIKGLIAGHNARISQICPYYFKVKVAVVSKSSEVKIGNN